MNCGLLGKKLSHSYSPAIHNRLSDYEYVLFEKNEDEVEVFLKERNFDGINVTIPYKKTVIPYLDELSDVAEKIGSVNTVVKRKDGTLFGHNTDYFGFSYMVKRSGVSVEGKKVIVLGDGGASLTVCTVLKDLKAKEIVVFSLFTENTYDRLNEHYDAEIIVNATPVGMYPNTGETLIEMEHFTKCEAVLDVIFNPAKTQLLLDAEKYNIPAVNGLSMLVGQALKSSEMFTDTTISEDRIEEIVSDLELTMKNIILVGMPGSGKSYIGKLLAEEYNKDLIDIDEKIVEKAGIPIPEIFEKYGEDHFRKIETEVLGDFCKQSGMIISTGGGAVTRAENFDIIRQNAYVIWVKRDISDLPKEGRPLSLKNNLEKMYEVRKPLYSQISDFSIENKIGINPVEIIKEKLNENSCY